MQSISFEGVGKMNGGEYSAVNVDGVCSCVGNIKAESIDIDGVFKCSGTIETDLLDCDGTAEFKSNIKAKRIEVDGVITVKGGTKIEASEIICDGVIKIDGEISADIIHADGFINAREIVGDQVTIKSRIGAIASMFTKWNYSTVDLIEATTISLRGVAAKFVNGKDITIGPRCKIDNLDCSGTLYIDKSAVVNNITGNYTFREY